MMIVGRSGPPAVVEHGKGVGQGASPPKRAPELADERPDQPLMKDSVEQEPEGARDHGLLERNPQLYAEPQYVVTTPMR